MQKKRYSLLSRIGAIYLITILVVVGAIGYYWNKTSSDILISKEYDQIQFDLDLITEEYEDYLDEIRKDVLFLANMPSLTEWIKVNFDTSLITSVHSDFDNLMKYRPEYDQMRWIAQPSGLEKIRIQRFNEEIQLVDYKNLQFKGKKEYVNEAALLKYGEVFFSEIDLNKEFGRISEPRMPTLRASTPVFNREKVVGVIVINLDLRLFFNKITQRLRQGQKVILMTNHRDYLMHPNRSKTFGFEFEQDGLAPKLSALGLKPIDPISLQEYPDDLFFFKSWVFPKKDYQLFLGLGSNQKLLLEPLRQFRKDNLAWLFFIIGIAITGLLIFTYGEVKRLNRITSLMTYPVQPNTIAKLPLKRKDEIGNLARSYKKLIDDLDSYIIDVKNKTKEAIQARKDKEEFVENMSHELRNPLQTIIGMRSILADNNPRNDQLPALDNMKFASDQLSRLVNDVLDYALIKSGELAILEEELHMNQFMNQILQMYQHEAAQKKMTLRLSLSDKIRELRFLGDKTRLVQVISNLISNAIKYAPAETRIEISAFIEAGQVKFGIQDQGHGIPKDILAQLNSRFNRSSALDQPEVLGTGLGLNIVIGLLKLMGSNLNIESQKSGTFCYFSIPLKTIKRINVSTQKLSPAILPGCPAVLFVEDDPELQYWYKHLASSWKVEYVIVSNVPKDKSQKFDFIISDLNLELHSDLLSALDYEDLLTEKGLLVWCSGAQPIDGMGSNWLVKPIQREQLEEVWLRHWRSFHRNSISLDRICNDYDYNRNKISEVLNLVLKQWMDMSSLILSTLKEGDAEGYESVFHKLTTTLKRLGLFDLDQELSAISFDDTQVDHSKKAQLYYDLMMELYKAIDSQRQQMMLD